MFKIKQIKNFAVIQKLKNTLELKDLTIFMGDNSAGKSYMAMLIHSFITMTRGYQDINFLKAINAKYASSSLLKKLSKNINNVLIKELDTLIISFDQNDKDTLKKIVNFSNEYLLKKYLTQALFEESNIEDIEIELNNITKLLPETLLIKYNKIFDTTSIEILIDKKERAVANFQGDFPKDIILTETINSILSTLIEKIVKKTLPINSVYLPASRTGYLQTYKTLANNAIFKNYDVDSNNNNHLSIIIRFFISQLNNNTSFKNNDFSDFIEKFIINGSVNIYKDNNNIEFQLSNGKKIDLNYLSSTVSELIPLVVFLKRGLIRKNGLIVIEEPEAHLSFKNQKLIAELIALFLQNKIKVLITTHSDFLIYEINNLIMKETINNLKNNNTSSSIGINHKQVGLYNFILEDSGSIIEKVSISKYGINNQYIVDNTYSLISEKNELIDLLDELNAKNSN
jgi:predicted ATPase